jgi:polysaccharide biosynthesis protein PslG
MVAAIAIAAVAVVAVVALSSPSGGGLRGPRRPAAALTPALAPPPGEVFGASVNRLFNDQTYSPAQIDAQLSALRATGATVARSDALWEASEPNAPVGGVHHWVWTFDDAIAASLAAHDLTWLPILDYSAPWAQSVPGEDHSPPRTAAGFAAYAAAFAGRYGTGGSFWRAHPALTPVPVKAIEVWNEPDNPEFWNPAPDAGGYARLYLATRAAIDAADPSARVIVGGLVNPATFLPAMAHAVPALAGHIDGVGVHPYGAPRVVLAKVRAARAALVALDMGAVPLYVTEFGWTTSPPGALDFSAASRRVGWIRDTLARLGHLQCGIAAVVLYTWVTPDHDPADSQDWFGVHAPNGSPTPSSTAFGAGLRAAASPGQALACGS